MASEAEIHEQLQRLIDNMTGPRGVEFDKAYPEYCRTLATFSLSEISETVDRILSGDVERVHKTTAYPRVAELVGLVRQVNGIAAIASEEAAKPAKKLYGYKPPNSKILEAHCTKDWARQLVDQGVHPRGSIWCPGSLNDRPDIGDLYGPDPDWHKAVPWPPVSDLTHPVEAELGANRTPMFATDWAKKMRSTAMPPMKTLPPPPAPRKVPDYSQDKIEITETLRRSLEQRGLSQPNPDDHDRHEGGT